VSSSIPVYLNFRNNEPNTAFSISSEDGLLLSVNQHYTVHVNLILPESYANYATGMFMIHLNFISQSGNLTESSIRPDVLHYKSGLFKKIWTIFYSLPLLLGFAEEKQYHSVLMFEHLRNNKQDPFVQGTISLSKNLQIYDISISAEANLYGISYFMYNWRITSFIVGVFVNFLWQLLVFVVLGYLYFRKTEEEFVVVEIKHRENFHNDIELLDDINEPLNDIEPLDDIVHNEAKLEEHNDKEISANNEIILPLKVELSSSETSETEDDDQKNTEDIESSPIIEEEEEIGAGLRTRVKHRRPNDYSET